MTVAKEQNLALPLDRPKTTAFIVVGYALACLQKAAGAEELFEFRWE
jgi:hypothetical protein